LIREEILNILSLFEDITRPSVQKHTEW